MRALKQFLKLKKGYCERQACRCLTVGMWRDYQNLPEVCDCGDGGSTPPVPPVPAEIPLESIETPSTDNETLIMGDSTQVSFGFTPTDANTLSRDVQVVSSDDSVVSASLASWGEDGVAYIGISSTGVGNATVTYSFGSTSYDIDVTVEPEIYMETITAPSENSVTLNEGGEIATVTFDYTPTNVNRIGNVSVSSSNTDVASGWISTYSSGTADLSIQSAAEGTATITYAIDGTSYDIAVTVNALP